ncbi:hypothetical protein KZC52_07480 [Microbacterium sp. kSW2-24]|uniref:hypothetical protein n=1 Tax=Microbacterium galbinum TaxID=2851646 RepID=UPI001FFC7E0C|nr:hypothetical protein [Microbacterium galbinum]MCK2022759.1 hypothetical protein [Microbacterium galbinum]
MFSEKYDDIRTILSNAQTNALKLSMELNQSHTENGGPGLSPDQQHAMIAKLTAEVHNLAFGIGNLVDLLEQDGVGAADSIERGDEEE